MYKYIGYLSLCISFMAAATDIKNNKDTVKRTGKILVLILASDDQPIYIELQKVWRKYMHLDPAHVEAYFMKANPHLKETYIIQDDTIWIKTTECCTPGITLKNIYALEAFATRLDEFDYIVRPNMSTFYIFPRLLEFLKTCPQNNFYCGYRGADVMHGVVHFASGSGFIISPDVALLLLKGKSFLYDNRHIIDDVLIGHFMAYCGIPLTSHGRIEFETLDDWEKNKDTIPDDVFQFRVKQSYEPRLPNEIYIQEQLIKKFYSMQA